MRPLINQIWTDQRERERERGKGEEKKKRKTKRKEKKGKEKEEDKSNKTAMEGFVFPVGNPTHSDCSLEETLITERSFHRKINLPGILAEHVVRIKGRYAETLA